MAGPRRRHHDRRTRRHAVADRPAYTPTLAAWHEPEVVAGDDDEPCASGPWPSRSARDSPGPQRGRPRRDAIRRTRPTGRALRPRRPWPRRRGASAKAPFGAMISGRAKPWRTIASLTRSTGDLAGVEDVDVGQQAAVVVAPDDVTLESDAGPVGQQVRGEGARLGAEALGRRTVGEVHLGRVDPEQPDTLLAPADRRRRWCPVDDVEHRRHVGRGGRRPVAGRRWRGGRRPVRSP